MAVLKDAVRSLIEFGKTLVNAVIWLVIFVPLWILIVLVIWALYAAGNRAYKKWQEKNKRTPFNQG
jgi:biopolymer transport protein ExbB/TolQ